MNLRRTCCTYIDGLLHSGTVLCVRQWSGHPVIRCYPATSYRNDGNCITHIMNCRINCQDLFSQGP